MIAAAQDALVDPALRARRRQSVAGLRADLGIPHRRTFDVWFDNIFSDLSVRSSIKDSQVRVDTAVTSVREAMQRMTAALRSALDQRGADLRAGATLLGG